MQMKTLLPPPSGRSPLKGGRPSPKSPSELDWEKLCAQLKPDLDFPALLELQATLGCPPPTN